MTDRELQSLRNLGCEFEAAADEIVQLRAAIAAQPAPIAGDWRTAAISYLRSAAEDRMRKYSGNPSMETTADTIMRLAEELELMQQAIPYGLDALAAQPAQEPVAWWRTSYEDEHGNKDADVQIGEACPSRHIPDNGYEWKPLYAAPVAAQPAQAQPLTEAEIITAYEQATLSTIFALDQVVNFARAVERAHGIGGKP